MMCMLAKYFQIYKSLVRLHYIILNSNKIFTLINNTNHNLNSMHKLSNTKHSQAQSQQQQQMAGTAFEKTIHFSQAAAIVWQIKFQLNQISSKKSMLQAANELESLSQQFGTDFDMYLLKELIEQIDLKDPVKAQKDKNEPLKVQLLNQELARCSQKPEFLQYFSEIAAKTTGEGRAREFLGELTKRLRLSFPLQLLVALSLLESSKEDSISEVMKLFKQKLTDYHNYGKPELLPEYAVHRILYLLSTCPELNGDESLRDVSQFLIDSNPLKPSSHHSLKLVLQSDSIFVNSSTEEPSYCILREGNGLDAFDKSAKMLEPWQILLDLGHYCSYNYAYLQKVLEDFKDISERTMVRTLLYLSLNHTGFDDQTSRIVYSCLELNKKGGDCSSLLKKEVASDKKTQMTWSIDNLARAFRELYSNLTWVKVFEALSEIEDDIQLDSKAFATFLSIFNKLKPQNLQYPLGVLLQLEWANPQLQLNFIENSIAFYVEKKEKSILFSKTDRRQELLEEITGVKEKVPIEVLHVWLSVDLAERLVQLSESRCFTRVRQMFDQPMKTVPEYLLLTLSLCKPSKGNLMLDELLSLLLPQFLGNHINSIPVLQALWRNNQALMIRGVCELCRHDQRIMNLSRVLDITQEVKESLIPIVNCEDYYFAVNLGILAGKRDFLHYDVWLQSRIAEIGTPFIKALLKYIKEHIILPIMEFQKKTTAITHGAPQQQQQAMAITMEQLELNKQQVLERSHLSKEKLCITIEHLSNPTNRSNQKVKLETHDHIRDVVTKIGEYFPSQVSQLQNSDEIDNAANEYFQKVFQADQSQVDQKIADLIETMQRFKESEVKKEQEIYACMLHSLFDEYRFLHRYPQQYLEKIAKLFGAIIKHKIIDGTLQDIALKFAYEAFRREGKRQKFGVITIKQFFEMLPQFPNFFEDIYEIRHNIQNTDPILIKDIEELYERTMKEKKEQEKEIRKTIDEATRGGGRPGEDSREAPTNGSKPAKNQSHSERKQPSTSTEQMPALQPMPKLNEAEFLNNFQQNQSTGNNNPAGVGNSGARGSSQTANPNQKLQQPGLQVSKAGQQMAGQMQIDMPRTTTPQTQAQLFIPSYRNKQQTVGDQQQLQQQVPDQPTQPQPQPQVTQGTLNVASAAFRKPGQTAAASATNQNPGAQQQNQVSAMQSLAQPATSLQQPTAVVNTVSQMNPVSARAFHPTNIRSPQPNQQVSQQTLQMQTEINEKIEKAVRENVKIRLEDLIEDSKIQGPAVEVQEQIKFICNNTGKQNQEQKLQELRGLITHQSNQQINLKWFLHHVLIRKVSANSNLNSIYIEMIQKSGFKEAIPLTIELSVELFKKCILVDEEKFLAVAQRAASQGSPVKMFLMNLGSFLGGMTVAANRPILAKELDIKQLLLEGFYSNKQKIVVIFVCRIFKECQKSNIFRWQNPWIKANLEILREIYDWDLANNLNDQYRDILFEIDSLFKALGINNINEVNHSGFLKASQQQEFASQSQRVELQHLQLKLPLIPAVQPPVTQATGPASTQQQLMTGQQLTRSTISPAPIISTSNMNFFQPPGSVPNQAIPTLRQSITPTPYQIVNLGQSQSEQMQANQDSLAAVQQSLITEKEQITERVIVSQEMLKILTAQNDGATQTNSTLSIAQKEQILRQKIAEAVDSSIVEILPPVVDRSVTIALITTRELVLKDFAYDGNYHKIIKAADLIVQNLAGQLALVTCREPLKMSLAQNLKKSLIQLSQQPDQEGLQLKDDQISDVSQCASKENLELGCKLIRERVIHRALAKVREDQQIIRAIEQRKLAQQQGIPHFQDDSLIPQFADLPPQLKPNPNGLTDAQFQVYEDFDRLSKRQIDMQSPGGLPTQPGATQPVSSSGSQQPSSQGSMQDNGSSSSTGVIYDIESYLKQFERSLSLEDALELQLTQKLKHMSAASVAEEPYAKEEQTKLWNYCQKWFDTICKKFNSAAPLQEKEKVAALIDGLALITAKYKGSQDFSDLSKKLTAEVFMTYDSSIFTNLDLTLTLMKRGILSIAQWDQMIVLFLKDTQQFQQMNEQILVHIRDFIEVSIQKQKIFEYSQLPHLISFITQAAASIEQFSQIFSGIIEDLKKFKGVGPSGTPWNKETLREYFNEWAVMSFEESNPKQEQEVNRFFNNLQQLGLYKDSAIMYSFCKVMVEVSIERALYTIDRTKRPADRLDYRYIESFLKLMVVLLKTSDINKHEFMSKLFEAIQEVLDEDHKMKKGDFNQKPYYRLLINILTAINNSKFFNPKAHLQILFSLADLFNKINPNAYPAFAFAWIELISHKEFMPHFLQPQPQQQPQNPNSQPSSKKGASSGSTSNTQQQQIASQIQPTVDNNVTNKWFKFKDLIVNLFMFLKNNMIMAQKMSMPLFRFYEAAVRIILVIQHDYPEFLSDFHFNFVNSLPDHCIQLRNVILSSQPRNIPFVDPYTKNLKVDQLKQIHMKPRMLSNYDNYLQVMNLREDLEKYQRTKNAQLIQVICDKMMSSEEILSGGRRKINSSIINAVVLYIGNFSLHQKGQGPNQNQNQNQKDCFEMLRRIMLKLNVETRLCVINSLVNEMRYINSYTYFYSWMVMFLFSESDESIQEQITRVLIERLQASEPHPWGLCITFRELLQNPKYKFATRSYVVQNMAAIEQLMQTRLFKFQAFWQNQKLQAQQQQQQQQQRQ